MRVAIVINTSWNIYNFRKELVQELINQGHTVVAIAPMDDFTQKLIDLGCEYEELPMSNKGTNPIQDLFLLLRMIKIYRKSRADIFLQFTIKPNIYGSLAAKFIGQPSACNVSGLGTVFLNKERLSSRIAQWLYKVSFSYPCRIFFQNEDDLSLFKTKGLIRHNRTTVLPGSGVNLSYFDDSFCQGKSNQINREAFTFLMVSRLLIDKGTLEYLEAAERLSKSDVFKTSKIKFKLLGSYDGSKGSIPLDKYQYFKKLPFIEMSGTTEDVRPHLCDADCVVLPSYREGTPKTLLEAIAMKRPIITTNVPGCKNVLRNQKNGYICEPKSVDSLYQAMVRMLNTKEEDRKEMGVFGRTIAEKEYDLKIVIKKYLELIHEIR